jgi:Ca2+-binding RTX toxin-like protein
MQRGRKLDVGRIVLLRTLRVLVVSAVAVLVAAQTAAAQTAFSNTTPIVIPGSGPAPAAPYPSTINASGLSAAVTDVDVTLNNVTHTFPDDFDVLLVGPQGQNVIVMSDAGNGDPGITDATLTLDDSAPGSIPDEAPPAPGAYKPTDVVDLGQENDTFDPPAPAGPYSTQLAAFNGTNPNGTWSLYVFDDATFDSGDIEGWSLRITVAPPTTAAPTISGNAVNHQTLTANPGATTGGSSTSFQWLRCDATCVPIPGATGTTYTLTEADLGRTIRVRQTVTGSGGTASADSAPTGAVAPDPSPCTNVFTGSAGNDQINGTTGGDRISGLGGADILTGAASNDCLSGGGGNDRMQGNAGADRLAGSAGSDRMVGGPGRDLHSGGGGNDRIDAGPGADRETGGGGRDTMSGGPGNDRMSGGAGNDKMNGNGGRNRLSGGAGNDRIAAVNGRRETVNCGPGRRDVARVDRRDRTRGCEVVRRPRG